MPIPVLLTILRGQAAGPYTPLTFRAALTASLKDNPNLTSIVGQRIYPQMLSPNAVLPAVTYKVIANSSVHNLAGAAGISEARVELKAFATDSTECTAIMEVLRNQFDGFNGGLPGSVIVVGIFKKLEHDAWEAPASPSAYGTHMTMNDFLFRYRESLPTFGSS